jgi:hypothetical protein
MKYLPGVGRWCLLAVVLLALGGSVLGGAPVFAASGTATSSASPSDTAPQIGDSIVVTIAIDVSGVIAPDNKLGSFTGSLNWDRDVLQYSGNSGILAGFTGVVNSANAATGHLAFNGAKATGATGKVVVLSLIFDAVGAGATALDLEYSAMAAASTFANLLPLLTVTDGQVVVPIRYTLTMAVDPVGGGTTNPAVGAHGYASGTVVNVTAIASATYEFDHWSGACTGTGTCQVLMSANKSVTAHFSEIPQACYNLTLGHEGQGSDPIADPTNSPGCPAGRYSEGETIVLSGAIPNAGWQISGWKGTSQNQSRADTNSITMPASDHAARVVYTVRVHLPMILSYETGNQPDRR